MMKTLRSRPADMGRARGRDLERRIGTDLRIARVTRGFSQDQVSRRSRVTQSVISEVETGKTHASVDVLARLAAACDHELTMKLYPVAGSSLRDTPQLKVAEHIIGQAHPIWHPQTEVPVGDPQGRAADLVLEHPDEVAHLEIETTLLDFQAQFRPAQQKRQALASRYQRPVRLVFVLRDGELVRERLAPHAEFIGRVLPVSSRAIWQAIRNGTPIGGDRLVFVRQSSRSLRSGAR
jgi:transcriptional regulator with XRE-family HTH domain